MGSGSGTFKLRVPHRWAGIGTSTLERAVILSVLFSKYLLNELNIYV